MTDHKTDKGLGTAPVKAAEDLTGPTVSMPEAVHSARYTTDPRAPLSAELELLRGLRAEEAPVLKGLRDIVEATHEFQDAKKARAAAILEVRKEHAAETPDLGKNEPEPSSMTTEPGERARRRNGVKQVATIAALCLVGGILFLFAITRTPKTNLGMPATSAAATAPTTTTAVHAVPTVTSGPVALTASPAPSISATVAPPPSAASPIGPTHLPHMPPSPHTSAIGPSNTEPTQVQEPIPAPATPASAGSPNPWKIKEH